MQGKPVCGVLQWPFWVGAGLHQLSGGDFLPIWLNVTALLRNLYCLAFGRGGGVNVGDFGVPSGFGQRVSQLLLWGVHMNLCLVNIYQTMATRTWDYGDSLCFISGGVTVPRQSLAP